MVGNSMICVDLQRVRQNASDIRQRTGVALLGVVKADAYGLGAARVAETLADLVDGWYVFDAAEAIQYDLWQRTAKPTICAVTPPAIEVEQLKRHHVRPGVWTAEQVRRYQALDPVLSVDTGMQRFACPEADVAALRKIHPFAEAYTHAARPEQAHRLRSLFKGGEMKLHAAGSALLQHADCWLDAVRPGLALYAGAVRVSLPLVEARDSVEAVGYTQFPSKRHGVVMRGYSNGMRRGACVINGRRQQILEVGMQSSYVSLDPADRLGDEVVLLGDELPLLDAATASGASPHETLVRLATLDKKTYRA